jgi:hypothetical protein
VTYLIDLGVPEHLDWRRAHLYHVLDFKIVLVQEEQPTTTSFGCGSCARNNVLVVGTEHSVRIGIQRGRLAPNSKGLLERS